MDSRTWYTGVCVCSERVLTLIVGRTRIIGFDLCWVHTLSIHLRSTLTPCGYVTL